MSLLIKILRGVVIGIANLIPGVSGGTMMVSMGIYETIIHCITHLFKEFKNSVKTLLPYILGMGIAIIGGSLLLKRAFADFPLPTNALFVGLILGSLPFILAQMKGEKIGWQGVLVFCLFFALVVVLKLIGKENVTEIRLNVLEIIKLVILGAIASAAMVIPGVSGSMILNTLGYYKPIVTGAIPNFLHGLTGGDWGAVLTNLGILLPFGLGILLGIFGIAKLIEVLLAKWKGRTYCAILGMVLASPVVILMDNSLYTDLRVGILIAAVLALAAGIVIALLLGDKKQDA